MSQVNLNIRTEENLKKEFDHLCEELGLSMSAAINVFMKTVVREQRIPFEIGRKVLNNETVTAIENVEKGKGLSKPMNSVAEVMDELNA